MTVQVEFWHLITLLVGFISVLCTFGMILLQQIDKRIDSQNLRITTLEKDFSEHKARLPHDYQRREDAIRFETALNAKIDAIGTHLMHLIERDRA